MPRGRKKKVEIAQPAEEVKKIEVPDTSHREEFIKEIEKHGYKPFMNNGIVYVVAKKPDKVEYWDLASTKKALEEASKVLQAAKEKVGYRGSYGATINKPKE